MAPKKRKGKMANKLAGMSDEERERYLQHRAAIQEEKRRRKEQLVATFIRNKLKREEAYTRINTAKINQNWRLLLRRIKGKELQQEVECMWHTFQRNVERREGNICALLGALDLAERQYGDMMQAHLEAVERLEAVHLEHVSDVRMLFNAQLKELIHKSMAEMAEIHVIHKRRERAIKTVLSAMEDAMPARNLARYQRKVQAEQLRQQLCSKLEVFTDVRQRKLECMWLEMKNILAEHVSKTGAKRKAVKKLQSLDREWMVELEDIDKRTRHLYRINALAESRLSDMKKAAAILTEQRNESQSCYKTLQSALERDLKKDEDKFRTMSVGSLQAIKSLQDLKVQGEKLLSATNLIRRFETEEEQNAVMAMLEESRASTKLEQQSDDGEHEEPGFTLEKSELKVFAKLENFWLRYNKVHVEVSTARIKRDMLLLENSQLRSKLSAYVSNIARSPSIYAQTAVRSRRSSIASAGRLSASVSEVSRC